MPAPNLPPPYGAPPRSGSHAELLALRARAEQQGPPLPPALPPPAPEEAQRLVEELQVHQVEMEMQYEALLLAQAEAQHARAEYLNLYDLAPVGFFTLTATGLITQLNAGAGRLLGGVSQRLAGRRFAQCVAPAHGLAFGHFLARVLATAATQSAELLLLREDGTPFFAQLEGLRADGPNGFECRLAVLDTDARHQTTQALATSEARFRTLFEKSHDAVVLLQGHHYVDCNEAALRLLGASHKSQLVDQPAWANAPDVQPDGRRTIDVLRDGVDTALRVGSHRCEVRMQHFSGAKIWVEAVLTPIELGGPTPLVHVVWRDVTAAHAAAALLRENEAVLALALEASEMGIYSWDIVRDQLRLDARAQAIIGQAYGPAPVPMAALVARLHPDDTARVWAVIGATAVSNAPLAVDYRVVWPSGEVRFVSAAGRFQTNAQGRQTSIVGVLRDVTSEHVAQEAVRESRERLQLALDASASGVWVWEVASNRLEWDAQAQAIFGHDFVAGPVPFSVLGAAVHPDDLPAVGAVLRLAFDKRTKFELEHRIRWADGQVRYVAAAGTAVFDGAGRPLRLVGVMRDVTPRREAQEALRREKEFTDSLLENSVDGLVALDLNGRITAWNAEMTRYFGPEAAAVLGRPLREALPHLDSATDLLLARAQAGERVTRPGRPFPNRPGRYDVFMVPLHNDGDAAPSGVLIIVRDVTERDRLAEEATQLRLRQQQEVLAAILATQETERKRIAEALHNGLGQLLYATKLSLAGHNEAPGTRESLRLLDEAIRAARTISFELTPGILEDFGLHTALEELVKRLAPTRLPVHLHLVNLGPRLPAPVEIAVYRVVQELLNNVMKHAQATEVVVHVAREGARLAVSVEDNGQGFEPAALANQPLAGIGLAGVRNRVALLGGELLIAAQLGRGTIVSFELDV